MGYAPDIWGPSTWHTIHLLCYTAPAILSATEQLRYITFFKALPFVLPCATCSEHLQEHYKTHPIENYVGSQASLFEWSVHIHNTVNQMLGKPIVSLESAKAIWAAHLKMDGGDSAISGVYDSSLGTNGYRWIFISLALFAVIAGIYLGYRGLSSSKISIYKNKGT